MCSNGVWGYDLPEVVAMHALLYIMYRIDPLHTDDWTTHTRKLPGY